nr:MAG: ORF1 [Torque teno polar bear virus 28]
MPYRRRYRARRRFTRRRHLFRYRRRRRWLPRRRRRFGRRRSVPVRQYRPRKTTHLTVRGWEFLGQLGTEITYNWTPTDPSDPSQGTWSIDLVDVAPVNKEVTYLTTMIPDAPYDYTRCTDTFAQKDTAHWDFVGGFGAARFTFRTLLVRALLGMARFSTSLKGWSYIRFKGFSFKLNRAKTIDYLFRASNHIGREDVETSLIHPASFLNLPFVKWVQSVARSKCCRSPVVRRKPDVSIYGWHDIEDFMHVPLICYLWTVFNPQNPMGRNPQITKTIASPIQNDWFKNQKGKQADSYCPDWNNRAEYDKKFVEDIDKFQTTNGQSWWEWINSQSNQSNTLKCAYGKYSLFTPPMIPGNTPQTLWFKYKFFFKVAGKSVGFSRQRWPVKEADTCPNCPNRDCDACIKPKRDLKRSGLLTKKAFKRITQPPNTTKERILAILARLVCRKLRKRKRVRWMDLQPPKKPRVALYCSAE